VERTAPLARRVVDAPDLDAAQSALSAAGIRTELDLERARARGEQPPLE
jgi:hypothetical protein